VLNRDSFFYCILFAAHSGAATAAAVAAGNRTISFQGMWNKACLSKSMPPEAYILGGIYFLYPPLKANKQFTTNFLFIKPYQSASELQ
jgi:hypothetical protein